MKFFKTTRLIAAVLLTMALAVSLSSSAEAKQAQGPKSINGIYAFGDSLSDDGNFFALTGQPAEPYFEGRVSNGIVWVEYLADALRLDSSQVKNFAVAGATTGRENENDFPGFEFPGLQDELDLFEAGLGDNQADPRALYIVWAGANDFFVFGPSEETIVTGVTNTVIAVQRLHAAGARRILVVNLPDLGLTPFGRFVDPVGLSLVSEIYNDALDNALDGLELFGVRTERVDSAATLRQITAAPRRFQFSNVTDSYLPFLPGGVVPNEDPNRYVFWDSVHPTTRVHFLISKQALRVIRRATPNRW